jgi:hypothetical protein
LSELLSVSELDVDSVMRESFNKRVGGHRRVTGIEASAPVTAGNS